MDSTIELLINGKTYTATRRITGKRNIRQSIIFMGHEEHDSQTYGPSDKKKMEAWAHFIFGQLVTRGWLGQSPLEPQQPHD